MVPFIVPTIEGRGPLAKVFGGGAIDILSDLPLGADFWFVAEEVLIRETLPEEAGDNSCFVGDLLGDYLH